MSDFNETNERNYSGLFIGGLALAVLLSIGGLIWSYTLSGRLGRSEQALNAAQQQNEKLASELSQTNARLRVTSETLGQSVGLTQKQLELKAQSLMAQQAQQRNESKRLEKEQIEARQQIGAVSTEVSNVKTDVGGVKTDVAKTQSDLQATQTKLESMKGDLGVQSGLIATNHEELEILKHKGDRNYYEFTITKGAKPQPVSVVSLQLKKTDTKRNRFNINVISDDKTIEKKDKTLNEPVQFYSGKDPMLYELVVNNINKNTIVGYVSAPKNGPQPLSK